MFYKDTAQKQICQFKYTVRWIENDEVRCDSEELELHDETDLSAFHCDKVIWNRRKNIREISNKTT